MKLQIKEFYIEDEIFFSSVNLAKLLKKFLLRNVLILKYYLFLHFYYLRTYFGSILLYVLKFYNNILYLKGFCYQLINFSHIISIFKVIFSNLNFK